MRVLVTTLLSTALMLTALTAGEEESREEVNKKLSSCNLLLKVIKADADNALYIKKYKALGCHNLNGMDCIVDLKSIKG